MTIAFGWNVAGRLRDGFSRFGDEDDDAPPRRRLSPAYPRIYYAPDPDRGAFDSPATGGPPRRGWSEARRAAHERKNAAREAQLRAERFAREMSELQAAIDGFREIDAFLDGLPPRLTGRKQTDR